MSVFLDMADAMKGRLEELAVLEGISVIVDRQKDLQAGIDLGIAKLGVCVSITFEGGAMRRDSKPVVCDPRYAVRVWATPILAEEGQPLADDVVEAVIDGLTDWSPEARPRCDEELVADSDLEIVPHKTYLIYEMYFRTAVTIPPAAMSAE